MPKPKADSELDALFASATAPIPKAYWDDLRAIVDRVLDGQPRPPFPNMQRFLNGRHGLKLSQTTVQKHFHKVKTECLDK